MTDPRRGRPTASSGAAISGAEAAGCTRFGAGHRLALGALTVVLGSVTLTGLAAPTPARAGAAAEPTPPAAADGPPLEHPMRATSVPVTASAPAAAPSAPDEAPGVADPATSADLG